MPIRIMIADDAPFIQEVMENLISKSGYIHVGTAASGDEAVRMALTTAPDVILMDVVMPRKNGIDAARLILEKMPQIRIIAVSTQNDEFIQMRALDAGCCEFMAKPFDEKTLIRAIENSIGIQSPEVKTS